MVSGIGDGDGLLVAANRDERADRPAVPITVLQASEPRILGGRDLLAGGTWLAVNEHGVVAGLTNTPTQDGPDRTKRSRGELPLAAARRATAVAAVEALASEFDPAEFNPAWMLVADRRSCFAVTVAGARPAVAALPPGVHVLENRAPGRRSAKVDHVLTMIGPLGPGTTLTGRADLRAQLEAVLRDHRRPVDPASGSHRPELLAACVHAGGYGTRSAAMIEVTGDPGRPPSLAVADGPPCRAPLLDRTDLWRTGPPAAAPGWEGSA